MDRGSALRTFLGRARRACALGTLSVIAVATLAASAPAHTAGIAAQGAGMWRLLPQAPIGQAGQGFTGVWTGSRMIVFGGVTNIDEQGIRIYAGAIYDPATDSWSSLPDLRTGNPYGYKTVWTGTELVAFSPLGSYAYNPRTNRWRRLPVERKGGAGGVVVWTGREVIDWGGGCCAEASSGGGAYDPTTNRWRRLAPSPLAASQGPIGAWTGRELIILVSGLDPSSGKPYPASFARAAAYNPTTDTWRGIAPPPALRDRATAVWDGHEVLLVGGAVIRQTPQPWPLTRSVLGYNPATNRWRRLAPLESGRVDCAVVWTGKRLLVWGGQAGTRRFSIQRPPRGFAYDPATNRWTKLPKAPLRGRVSPAAVWTGKTMIVWGGGGLPNYRSFTDGAAFTPATP